MKQFQAGYILDSLSIVFEKKSFRQIAFKELAEWCSHFNLDSISKFEENNTLKRRIKAIKQFDSKESKGNEAEDARDEFGGKNSKQKNQQQNLTQLKIN